MKNKILFISETVTMAHLIRPLKVASSLSAKDYEVHFAATRIPEFLRPQLAKFQVHELSGGVTEAQFLAALRQGGHPYTEAILRDYVNTDLALLRKVQPQLVVGDMRLSLKISCEVFGVPYVNLSNSTWDSGAIQEEVVPDVPAVRVFGDKWASKVFPLVRKPIMRMLARPFNKVAKSYGVKPYGSYYDVLTSGDYTVYNDLKSLVEHTNLSPKKITAGALIYPIAGQGLKPLELAVKGLPRVVVSLGSSGPSQHLQDMLNALCELPIELIVATSGQPIRNPRYETVTISEYLPLDEVLADADLLIFNGGSGAGYIALSHGVPLLAVPSNLDQHQFSKAIEKRGAAQVLRSEQYDREDVVQLVEKMLRDSQYMSQAQGIALEMKSENPLKEIGCLIETILQPKDAENIQIRTIVADAVRAPSESNCQPWQFQWNGDFLLISHDEKLGAHALNRAQHSSLLSLGATLEAISISASQFGLVATSRLLMQGSMWAEVRFAKGARSKDSLVNHLSKRTTDHRPFLGGGMTNPVFAEIVELNQSHPLAQLRVQKNISLKLVSYFLQSEQFLWRNKRNAQDLLRGMRLTEREATETQDGRSWRNLSLELIDVLVLRTVRRFPVLMSLLWPLVLKSRVAAKVKANIESAAGLICISVHKVDPASICEAGRLAFRTWVSLNSQGYGVQPLTFASLSVADLLSNSMPAETSIQEKAHFAQGLDILSESFGLSEDDIPLWVFRTGLSEALPAEMRTPRRDLDEVFVSYRRKSQRVSVEQMALCDSQELQVRNISKSGLGAVSAVPLSSNEGPKMISLKLNEQRSFEVLVKQVWQRRLAGAEGASLYESGYEVVEASEDWVRYVDSVATSGGALELR